MNVLFLWTQKWNCLRNLASNIVLVNVPPLSLPVWDGLGTLVVAACLPLALLNLTVDCRLAEGPMRTWNAEDSRGSLTIWNSLDEFLSLWEIRVAVLTRKTLLWHDAHDSKPKIYKIMLLSYDRNHWLPVTLLVDHRWVCPSSFHQATFPSFSTEGVAPVAFIVLLLPVQSQSGTLFMFFLVCFCPNLTYLESSRS